MTKRGLRRRKQAQARPEMAWRSAGFESAATDIDPTVLTARSLNPPHIRADRLQAPLFGEEGHSLRKKRWC